MRRKEEKHTLWHKISMLFWDTWYDIYDWIMAHSEFRDNVFENIDEIIGYASLVAWAHRYDPENPHMWLWEDGFEGSCMICGRWIIRNRRARLSTLRKVIYEDCEYDRFKTFYISVNRIFIHEYIEHPKDFPHKVYACRRVMKKMDEIIECIARRDFDMIELISKEL